MARRLCPPACPVHASTSARRVIYSGGAVFCTPACQEPCARRQGTGSAPCSTPQGNAGVLCKHAITGMAESQAAASTGMLTMGGCISLPAARTAREPHRLKGALLRPTALTLDTRHRDYTRIAEFQHSCRALHRLKGAVCAQAVQVQPTRSAALLRVSSVSLESCAAVKQQVPLLHGGGAASFHSTSGVSMVQARARYVGSRVRRCAGTFHIDAHSQAHRQAPSRVCGLGHVSKGTDRGCSRIAPQIRRPRPPLATLSDGA
jgi:hypothetical protein